MSKVISVLFLCGALFLGCQSTPSADTTNAQTTADQTQNTTGAQDALKVFVMHRNDGNLLGFNLNGESFVLRSDVTFTGARDVGSMQMLVGNDLILNVRVTRLSDFMEVGTRASTTQILEAYFDFDMEHEIENYGFEVRDSATIREMHGRSHIFYSYYAPNYDGSDPNEIYKVVNRSFINDQAVISLYVPLRSPDEEQARTEELDKIVPTFKDSDEIVTAENIVEIATSE